MDKKKKSYMPQALDFYSIANPANLKKVANIIVVTKDDMYINN